MFSAKPFSGITASLCAVVLALSATLAPCAAMAELELPEGSPLELEYNRVKDSFEDSPWCQIRPLGVAGNFHIVAFDTATLSAHTNGNILAKELIANSNFGTNGYTNELSYAQTYTRPNGSSGAATNHTLAVGSGNELGTVDNGQAFSVNGTKIDKPKRMIADADTETAPFIDLEEVRRFVAAQSATFAEHADSNVTANFRNQNDRRLTIETVGETRYYNMTAEQLNSYSGNPLKLWGFKRVGDKKTGDVKGNLIINVDCTDVKEITMPQEARMYIREEDNSWSAGGTDEVTRFDQGRVLWNFVNAEGVKINGGITEGSILAVGATFDAKQNLNGTIIADNVQIDGETHRTDYFGLNPYNDDGGWEETPDPGEETKTPAPKPTPGEPTPGQPTPGESTPKPDETATPKPGEETRTPAPQPTPGKPTPAPTATPGPAVPDLPQTGDGSSLSLLALMATLSLAGACLLRRKSR